MGPHPNSPVLGLTQSRLLVGVYWMNKGWVGVSTAWSSLSSFGVGPHAQGRYPFHGRQSSTVSI